MCAYKSGGWKKAVLRGLYKHAGSAAARSRYSMVQHATNQARAARARAVKSARMSKSSYQAKVQSLVRNSTLNKFVRAKKRVRRYRTKRLSSYQLLQKGITFVSEYRDAPADTNVECSYIGHVSLPQDTTLNNILRAMTKAIIIKGGRDLPSMNVVLTSAEFGAAAGDTVRIAYYATTTTSSISYVDYVIIAGDTLDTVALTLASSLSVIGPSVQSVRWAYMEYRPVGTGSKLPFGKIELTNAKLALKTKSILKVQNRTVNAVGDIEITDVDNVPLQGKLYKAKGNAFLHIATRNVYTSATSNVIRSTVARDLPLSEPPLPQEFENCRAFGKIRMNPGAIQTSRLYHDKVYTLSDILNVILSASKNGYDPNLGEAQMFGLEKVIGNYATPVLYAYEFEFKQQAALLYKESSVTEQVVDQN